MTERFSTTADAELLGQRVDGEFLAGLSAMPETENRKLLLQSVAGLEDVFETYDTGELADFYTGVVKTSPLAMEWMTWKYGLLAERVEHLSQTDAALDLYAGPATYGSHQFLFGALFRAILGESAILAMLGTLYLLGYEGCTRRRDWPAQPEQADGCGESSSWRLCPPRRWCTDCWRASP